MRKHWGVAHQLVDDVGLGSVKRILVVSDVLSWVEHFESQAIKELPLGKQSANRLESPACFLLQKAWDIFELWNFCLTQADLLLELIYAPVELVAGICLKHVT